MAKAENDAGLIRWIRSAARRSRRVTSVCSGAFLLARAGLLEGRTCTTHWASTAELARRHPELTVDPNPIFVRDGNVWTSAGVTSGMDLSLALVEEDLGRETAVEIARWLVLFLQRPGGQAQFSTHLSAQLAERRPLRELQSWIADNLDADLRVEALAERAAMSPRNFARFFRRETGMTPAAYVEELRVERARQLLEESTDPVELVSARCGFGTPETMRRAFSRRVGVAPAAYRARFQRMSESATSTRLRGDPMQIAYLLYDRFTALDITGPHDVLNSVPGNESIFVAEQAGPIRNESDTLSLGRRRLPRRGAEPRHRRRPRRLRQPHAARARAAARVDPWRARDQHLDDLGLHRLAAAGRRGAARRRPGDHPLAGPGCARRARCEAGSRPGRRARQDRHRRRGLLRASTWRSTWSEDDQRREGRAGGPARASSTTPQPPLDAGSPEKAPQEIVELVTAAFEAREAAGVRPTAG